MLLLAFLGLALILGLKSERLGPGQTLFIVAAAVAVAVLSYWLPRTLI